jgi:hypothetical protein
LLLIVVAGLPRAMIARARTPMMARAARFAFPLMLVAAWVIPARAATYQGAWNIIEEVRDRSIANRTDIPTVVRAAGIENALVFVPDHWHGQIAARLRAIGAPSLQAESMLREFDACVLDMALDAEDRIPGPPGRIRVARVARQGLFAGQSIIPPGTDGSRVLAFIPKRTLSVGCTEKWQNERNAIAFDALLPRMRFDRDGRLTGNVIYARDLGLRNQMLIGRFGDRAWYRYQSNQGAAELVPYSPYR